MKKLLIFSLLLILSLIFLFWLFVIYGVIDRTMLNSLGKYPNSTSWRVFRNTGIPTYMGLTPTKHGSGARFTTNDDPNTIFIYYDSLLKKNGWSEAPIFSSGNQGTYDINTGIYSGGDYKYKIFNKNLFGTSYELRIQIYNCPAARECDSMILVNSSSGN